MAKNIRGFLENLFKYTFLNIIVNVNIFSDLKFEYYCEYYPEILYKKALNKKLKLMGGAINYLPKKLLGHEILRSMVSWATNFFLKICKTLRPIPTHPSFYILNACSLKFQSTQ